MQSLRTLGHVPAGHEKASRVLTALPRQATFPKLYDPTDRPWLIARMGRLSGALSVDDGRADAMGRFCCRSLAVRTTGLASNVLRSATVLVFAALLVGTGAVSTLKTLLARRNTYATNAASASGGFAVSFASRPQVLSDGGERELVLCTAGASQPQAAKSQNALQVRKQHLDLFAVTACLLVSLCLRNFSGDVTRRFMDAAWHSSMRCFRTALFFQRALYRFLGRRFTQRVSPPLANWIG